MKHDDYESLKKKVEKKSFFEEYKGIKGIGTTVSFLLQGILIFFGYFFFKDVYSKIAEQPSGFMSGVIVVSAVITITLFELIKRSVYSKFSKDFVDSGFKFSTKALYILFFVSIVMVAGSFYFSISGAKELSSKEVVMVTETKNDIKLYSDSLSKIYNEKIVKFEAQNEQLFNVNLTIQTKIDELPQWSKERNQYRTQINGNKETIKNNELQVKELKAERDKSISDYDKKQNGELEENKSDNNSVIWIFIIGAVVVELLVSVGIFFQFLYNSKSVEEYEKKLKENPQYKTWEAQNQILDLLFTFRIKKGGSLPPLKNFEDLAKTQGMVINKKQLSNTLKMFAHLDILNMMGSKKQLIVDEEEARKILKDHHKIM